MSRSQHRIRMDVSLSFGVAKRRCLRQRSGLLTVPGCHHGRSAGRGHRIHLPTVRGLAASMLMPVLLVFVGLPSGGCTRPPDAPTEFTDLCGFVYDHMEDKEEATLAAGVLNLHRWLAEHAAEVRDGVVVHGLSAQATEPVDPIGAEQDALVGVAFAREFDHGLGKIVKIMVRDTAMDISPTSYLSYERTWLSDTGCFLTRACRQARFRIVATAKYALGLEATYHIDGAYRWVKTEDGLAMVARTWLTQPGVFSWESLEMRHSYYLSITFELPEGRAERAESSWILASMLGDPVSSDMAFSLAINSVKKAAARFDTYLQD